MTVPPPVPEATPLDAREAVADGAVLLDVREPHEWNGGHAPEATHIPMRAVPEAIEDLRDRQVYVVCFSGQRSAAVTRWLQQQGVDATNVAGGMLAWVEADLPMEGRLVH